VRFSWSEGAQFLRPRIFPKPPSQSQMARWKRALPSVVRGGELSALKWPAAPGAWAAEGKSAARRAQRFICGDAALRVPRFLSHRNGHGPATPARTALAGAAFRIDAFCRRPSWVCLRASNTLSREAGRVAVDASHDCDAFKPNGSDSTQAVDFHPEVEPRTGVISTQI
jgi:hypothetical protein